MSARSSILPLLLTVLFFPFSGIPRKAFHKSSIPSSVSFDLSGLKQNKSSRCLSLLWGVSYDHGRWKEEAKCPPKDSSFFWWRGNYRFDNALTLNFGPEVSRPLHDSKKGLGYGYGGFLKAAYLFSPHFSARLGGSYTTHSEEEAEDRFNIGSVTFGSRFYFQNHWSYCSGGYKRIYVPNGPFIGVNVAYHPFGAPTIRKRLGMNYQLGYVRKHIGATFLYRHFPSIKDAPGFIGLRLSIVLSRLSF